MAMSTQGLLLLTFLPLLFIAASARPFYIHPCKTILFISSSTSSYPENPNLSIQNPDSQSGRSITFFFTDVHEFNPIFSGRDEMDIEKPQLRSEFDSSVSSSFRDRTVDIMSVVGALLFGVGCGALTAGTMYMIWSLFSPTQFDDYENDDESDYDDASPKKIGYVAIPSVTAKEVV